MLQVHTSSKGNQTRIWKGKPLKIKETPLSSGHTQIWKEVGKWGVCAGENATVIFLFICPLASVCGHSWWEDAGLGRLIWARMFLDFHSSWLAHISTAQSRLGHSGPAWLLCRNRRQLCHQMCHTQFAVLITFQLRISLSTLQYGWSQNAWLNPI